MTYNLHLTNGDDMFHREFSADEFCMFIVQRLEIYYFGILVFFFLFLVKLYHKRASHISIYTYLFDLN